MRSRPRVLVEPFAGGGIITLTALFEDLVESVVMVELDEEIAAVWQAVVDGEAVWLAKRILEGHPFPLVSGDACQEIRESGDGARAD